MTHPKHVLTLLPHATVAAPPRTLWFTGLSGAGKSTLARALETSLIARQRAVFVLDGDDLRTGLNKGLGFSPEDRAENIRRVAEVARLMNRAGLIVLAALVSPFMRDREIARNIIGAEVFREVHVSTPLSTCEARDTKTLYRKARAGLIPDFTGIGSPYEHPHAPDLEIDTTDASVEEILPKLLALIESA
ncbi:MAG: adenylyl-sulfate kinase [Uliginosibacterium sp.]|nr:adenylyl-sulfate kinase [Uliginosibacterium sp.]